MFSWDYEKLPLGKFPCPNCRGSGRISLDDGGPNGYDRPTKIKCPNCNGEKFGFRFRQHWINCYKTEKEKYKNELLGYNLMMKLFKQAKAKLKASEIDAIKYFGVEAL